MSFTRQTRCGLKHGTAEPFTLTAVCGISLCLEVTCQVGWKQWFVPSGIPCVDTLDGRSRRLRMLVVLKAGKFLGAAGNFFSFSFLKISFDTNPFSGVFLDWVN